MTCGGEGGWWRKRECCPFSHRHPCFVQVRFTQHCTRAHHRKVLLFTLHLIREEVGDDMREGRGETEGEREERTIEREGLPYLDPNRRITVDHFVRGRDAEPSLGVVERGPCVMQQ